jgi:hypothetical protein
LAFTLMVVSLVGASARHPEQQGTPTVCGVGLGSCGTWLSARKAASGTSASVNEVALAVAREQWVLGFVSGLRIKNVENTARGLDQGGIWVAVDKECEREPLQQLAVAVMTVAARIR